MVGSFQIFVRNLKSVSRSNGGEGDFKKVRGHLLETAQMKYSFIEKNRIFSESRRCAKNSMYLRAVTTLG
ncbi:hypothetical protein LEP1GSC133_4105 [Leptospira borgpetersenii serovar Pomona str. 200901868]|uniref:Uncharacterized protein n=1 Tax=Leptospira borgpetersenii serovar Pomona str. 200901868 TaxID=1192866 RepID=M6WCV4_LEPBO|nr:hypothetical protein LEP1GSC133_4105 [Leptospira borgpetersenii serovar Pomona str. 200901868]